NRMARRRCVEIVQRGITLGLPIAHDQCAPDPGPLFSAMPAGEPRRDPPLVIDFSSLWAGPLAASLLAMTGAEVIKIESVGRVDGARRGNSHFYNLLNGAKRTVAVDFGDAAALKAVHRLLERAHIVIEGSRPRALHRLGIDRESFV